MPLLTRTPQSLRLAVLCAGLALAAPGRVDPLPPLPDFGDVSGNILTPAAERRLGQAFMRSIRASEKVLDDPLLDDYLAGLGKRLARHTDVGEHAFSFFFVDDPSINAFAGPGGYIGIHTGLVLTSESESELAAVLAHEIAHVTQKHLARTWQAASDMSVPQAAVLIAAAVLGATVGADAGMAAIMGGQAAALQRQIDFTRANEHEADRVGIALLAEAGYEPRAMASFFTRMGRANRDQTIRLPEFLQTHPVTTSRIAEALDRAGSHGYRQPADDLRYQLLRQRLNMNRQDGLAPLASNLEEALKEGRYRNRDAARFGLALALHGEQRTAEALVILAELRKAHPEVLEFAATEAQLRARGGDYARALAILSESAEAHPYSTPLTLIRCSTLLEAGRTQQAIPLLNALLEAQPDDPRGHALAARAMRETGRPFASHEHLARYHYLRGNAAAATQQLEIALRLPDISFYDASRVEAQLATYRAELSTVRAGQ